MSILPNRGRVFLHSRNTPSNGSSSPDGFGPSLWFTLHTAAVHSPNIITPSVKENWKLLLKNLTVLIPCQVCKNHYVNLLKDIDLADVTSSKKKLFEFTVNLHNLINMKMGRSTFSMKRAKDLYGYDTNMPNITLSMSSLKFE